MMSQVSVAWINGLSRGGLTILSDAAVKGTVVLLLAISAFVM